MGLCQAVVAPALVLAVGGGGESRSSRSALPTERVPGLPGLHRETVLNKQANKQTKKSFFSIMGCMYQGVWLSMATCMGMEVGGVGCASIAFHPFPLRQGLTAPEAHCFARLAS